MDVPDDELQGRVGALMGKRPAGWRRAHGGYTPAQRWVVSFADGSTAFIKSAAGSPESPMDEWLRREHSVYSRLEAPFMPQLFAWDDDGVQPVLVLEDLSGGFWPPPWTQKQVATVLETLSVLRATPLSGLPPAEVLDPDLPSHWSEVERDPGPSCRSASAAPVGWMLPCRH